MKRYNEPMTEEEDIKQFYEHQERVFKELSEKICFRNCNGYVYIDVKENKPNDPIKSGE